MSFKVKRPLATSSQSWPPDLKSSHTTLKIPTIHFPSQSSDTARYYASSTSTSSSHSPISEKSDALAYQMLEAMENPRSPIIAEFILNLSPIEKVKLAYAINIHASQEKLDKFLIAMQDTEKLPLLVQDPTAEELIIYGILTERISVHTGSSLLLHIVNFKINKKIPVVISPLNTTKKLPTQLLKIKEKLTPRAWKIFCISIAQLSPADRLVSKGINIDTRFETLGTAIVRVESSLWISAKNNQNSSQPEKNTYRHLIVSPAIADCLSDVLYKKNAMRATCVIGSKLSPPKSFENPSHRHVYIPTSYCLSPTSVHDFYKPDPFQIYLHDLHHIDTEGQNPHRVAWIEFAKGFEEVLNIYSSQPYHPELHLDKLKNIWSDLLDRPIRYHLLSSFAQICVKEFLSKTTLPQEIAFLTVLQSMIHFLKENKEYPRRSLPKTDQCEEIFINALVNGLKRIQEKRSSGLCFTPVLINWFKRDATTVRQMLTQLFNSETSTP